MSYNPTEHEQKTLSEGRLMRAEAEVVLPMLHGQREATIATLIWEYKKGNQDGLAVIVAKLVAIEDMRSEITNKIRKAEVIEKKVFAEGKGENQ